MTDTNPNPWDFDASCICGHTGRKHHPPSGAYPYTCSLCSCMYFETPPVSDARPLHELVADAIRCTTHIDDRLLRARYIVKDLQTRGVVLQKVARDERGRFVA